MKKILCDVCGKNIERKFKYKLGIKPLLCKENTFSVLQQLDICEDCFERIKKAIRETNIGGETE